MHRDLRDSAAHVFVDAIDEPSLVSGDEHHLIRVLRLRDGDRVSASDGNGRWRPCVMRSGALEVAGAVAEGEPARQCAVGAAIPKGDRLDWMVQKLTEVGVQRIVLLESDHSVVRWDPARAARQLERLQRIAREAAAQSRRCRLPVIEGPAPYGAVIAEAGAAIADPDGPPLAAGPARGPLLIGPEGGWSAAERSAASQAGAAVVSLGATVLRVETAAVVAAALMMSASGIR
ncbi:MAG: hypothetical protein RLY45_2336 [Actinomycetota bacterium]